MCSTPIPSVMESMMSCTALCRRFQKARTPSAAADRSLGDVGLDDEYGVGVIQIIMLYLRQIISSGPCVRVTANAHLKNGRLCPDAPAPRARDCFSDSSPCPPRPPSWKQ